MNLRHAESRRKRNIFIFTAINAGILLCIPAFFLCRRIMYSINPALLRCILHDTAHLYCPTCGGTRAAMSLLHADIAGAIRYNAFAVSLAAVFLYYDIRALINIIKGNQKIISIRAYVWIPLLIWLAVFAAGRNLLMIYCGIDPLGDLIRFWI